MQFPYYEGHLPHLGRHYDLEVDGRPMRIVLVGQEYGHAPALAGLADRSTMIAASAQRGFPGGNPHMKGTTSMLRLPSERTPLAISFARAKFWNPQ